MTVKRANGEGNVYQRPDGLWVGRATIHLVGGGTKRVKKYGKTQSEAAAKLAELTHRDRVGLTPRGELTVGNFLDNWLTAHVRIHNRPRTVERYEALIRVYLKPAFGSTVLTKLTAQDVQASFNGHLAAGKSVRLVQQLQQVLRAALSHAERIELVEKNVARRIVLPAYHRKMITPWTVEEQQAFLNAAADHPWYGAYFLLLNYGLRRGEVLGLHWDDVDFEHGTIRVRRQLQRIAGMGLQVSAVKTRAGERLLPLTDAARATLQRHIKSARGTNANTFVFTSAAGTPVDPKNFARAFREIREAAGVPPVTLHHLRHTAATNLKAIGAAATDAQYILGHAHVSTTMQIYTHSDVDSQRTALDRLGASLAARVETRWPRTLAQ